MSEELLKELLEETKKQNKIQEEVKREMELQNDLMIFFIENAREVVSNYRYSSVGNKLVKGRLYARLSDEDRSVLERSQDIGKDEVEMYHRVTGGFDSKFMINKRRSFESMIKGIQIDMLNDVYTEREVYDFFARAFERGGLSKSKLDYFWEEEWQSQKDFMDKEDDDEYEQKFMEKYENRITKEYGKIRNRINEYYG